MSPLRNLSDRDLRDILRVSSTALECTGVDELRREVLRLLEEVFKTGSSNFFLCSTSDEKVNLDHVVTRGVGERHLESFRRYYYKLDPFYRQIFPSHTSIVTNEQVTSRKDFVKSEYYNDFLREQSIHHEMVIYLKSHNRRLGVIALFRPPRGSSYSTGEMAKAELMAPCLAGALEKARVSEHLMESDGIIKSMTSAFGSRGILILDESLQPLYQNEAAAKIASIIGEADGSGENSLEALPQELYSPCLRVITSLDREKRASLSHEPLIQHIRAGERDISIRYHAFSGRENSTLFLIYLDVNKSSSLLPPNQNSFGLTRREMEIANLIYAGLKNAEISEKLFISEHTVENHLKSIYQKLGINSRTRLIHRLSHNGSGSDPSEGFSF